MDKMRTMYIISRIQRIMKMGIITSTVMYGVLFVILYIWEINATGTLPAALMYSFIGVALLTYAFGGVYFINKVIIRILLKRKKK